MVVTRYKLVTQSVAVLAGTALYTSWHIDLDTSQVVLLKNIWDQLVLAVRPMVLEVATAYVVVAVLVLAVVSDLHYIQIRRLVDPETDKLYGHLKK